MLLYVHLFRNQSITIAYTITKHLTKNRLRNENIAKSRYTCIMNYSIKLNSIYLLIIIINFFNLYIAVLIIDNRYYNVFWVFKSYNEKTEIVITKLKTNVHMIGPIFLRIFSDVMPILSN